MLDSDITLSDHDDIKTDDPRAMAFSINFMNEAMEKSPFDKTILSFSQLLVAKKDSKSLKIILDTIKADKVLPIDGYIMQQISKVDIDNSQNAQDMLIYGTIEPLQPMRMGFIKRINKSVWEQYNADLDSQSVITVISKDEMRRILNLS